MTVQQSNTNLIKQFPTLESLFGELDFCECEHCRSVLSPAAYLVDLLRFLDPDPNAWQSTLAHWQTAHGAPYPLESQDALTEWTNAGQRPPAPMSPYECLVQRRPDLPQLQLSCENTNTALPYIDVVNEILEYAVANDGNLNENAVRDVGEARTEDLLAEPQYVLTSAYTQLRKARHPLTLPFDLWLETVRRYMDSLGVPMPRLLQAMCPADDLTAPASVPTGRTSYGWRDVFTAQLGLSPAEYAIMTDPTEHAQWHRLYGYGDKDAKSAPKALALAPTLAKRLGVSYQHLMDLIGTEFVNPRQDALAALRRVGLRLEDVLRYFSVPGPPPFTAPERAAFEALVAERIASFDLRVGVATWLDAVWNNGASRRDEEDESLANVLVLADTTADCSFANTTLCYADRRDVDAPALLRLNLLTRLQRRLGWSLNELDEALVAFLPAGSRPFTLDSLGPAMGTALLGLAHLATLAAQANLGPDARRALLVVWRPLSRRRYAELFLTPGKQVVDPAFDDPLGQYLTTGDSLAEHLAPVQAALNLTTEEVTLILADVGLALDSALLSLESVSLLSLESVSLLARYRMLATALRLPVKDLITLKALSGVDPFTPGSAHVVDNLVDDAPAHHTLRFVELVDAVRDSGLTVDELNYLLRHRFDPQGPFAPHSAALWTLIDGLAADIGRIRAQNAVPADALTFTDAQLTQQVMLVLPPDVAETFLAMWAGTLPYQTSVAGVADTEQLDPKTYAAEPAITVSYDPVQRVQTLTYRGVLMPTELTRLATAYPSPLLKQLLAQVPAQARDFFAAHLEQPVGFLTTTDFDTIFAPMPTDSALQQQWSEARRRLLADAFLPFVRRQLIRRLVVATLAGALAADPALVGALVTDVDLLSDPSVEPTRAALLDAFVGAADAGLTAHYFLTADGSGPPSETVTLSDVDTAGVDTAGKLLKPVGTRSARIEGYLQVPADGAYRFFLARTNVGVAARLSFDHLVDPLLSLAPPDPSLEASNPPTELRTGVTYRFAMDARGLGSNMDVTLLVQAKNLAKGSLERLTCHPQAAVTRLQRANTLLAKAVRLAGALGLDEAALRYLLGHSADFDGLNLSALPTRVEDDTPLRATGLTGQFLRLVACRRLARDLGVTVDALVDVFQHTRRDPPLTPNEVLADLRTRFGALTRRSPEAVSAAAAQLWFGPEAQVAGYVDERGLGRLWEVLSLAQTLGVDPAALGRWANPAPDELVAHDIRSTLRARYDKDAWQRVVRPVSDVLRQARRDALVAYLLELKGFDRVEQLYEYFLLDPGTEPVVQTSRLRLAISCVQLFIQRCLLNLEPWVPPSMIDGRWQWMKRYRVWEANRKIFLWPENWLEPEFRTSKTHLCRTLEGALLQGDVTNDLAEDAFLEYLVGLEELARLEIMSVWQQEIPTDSNQYRLHVLGRTYHQPHKYFYRTYANLQWTPWEPVTTKIDGDHVVLAIWRDRPYLFWLTFMDRPAADPNGRQVKLDQTLPAGPPTTLEVQLNWSGYTGGRWSAGSTSGFDSPLKAKVNDPGVSFELDQIFVYASVDRVNDHDVVTITLAGKKGWDAAAGVDLPEGKLPESLTADTKRAFQLAGRNSLPALVDPAHDFFVPFEPYAHGGRYDGYYQLYLWYEETSGAKVALVDVLGSATAIGGRYGIVIQPHTSGKRDISQLTRPFFYQDDRNTFYVEPRLVEPTMKASTGWRYGQSDPSSAPLSDHAVVYPSVPLVDPPNAIHEQAMFTLSSPPQSQDMILGAGRAVVFDGAVIGRQGGATTTT